MLRLIALLAAVLSGVTLNTTLTDNDLILIIRSDAPRHVYVQLDPIDGAAIGGSSIYEFDLDTGDSFGRTVPVFGPGAVRVRVWAGDGDSPVADQTIALAAHHVYLPLLYRAAIN